MKFRFTLLLFILASGCASNPKVDQKTESSNNTPLKSAAPSSENENARVSKELQTELQKVALLAKSHDPEATTAPEVSIKLQPEAQPTPSAAPAKKTKTAKNAAQSPASETPKESSKEPSKDVVKETVHAPSKETSKKTPDLSLPDKYLGWLKNGNTRFLRGSLRKDGQSAKDIQKLSERQNPHSVIVSCSDSRVPPELIFDQKLGEVFVVRTAGESTGANTVASVEYAVEHLGAKLIIVMGHTKCGAVKAAIESLSEKDAGSPSLNLLVQDLLPRIKTVASPSNGPAFEKEAWANADGIAADLINQSAIVKKAVGSGEIKVVIALYHVETGKVEFAD